MKNQIEIQASIQVGKFKHTFTFESVKHLEMWAAWLSCVATCKNERGVESFVERTWVDGAKHFGVVHHHRTKYNTEKA